MVTGWTSLAFFLLYWAVSAGQDDTVKHWDARLDVPQLRSGKISCSEHHLPLWVSVAQICKAQGDDSKLAQLLVFGV